MLLEELITVPFCVTIAEDMCPFIMFCVNSWYEFISEFCTRESNF